MIQNAMDKIRIRSFVPEIRKKNTETRTITFVASDGTRDSAHTVLNQDNWRLERYNANPIIGYQHEVYGAWNTNDVDFVIGKGKAYVDDGKLLVDITFEPKEINELAEKVYQKVLFGSLNAVSVGFVPVGRGAWGEGDEAAGEPNETYYYAGQELLEISVVNIPANPNATRKGEDYAAEELEALRKEAEKPAPKKDEDDADAEQKARLQKGQIVLAAASAALFNNK